MTHVLDRPIWSALATRHAALAEGGPLAKRFPSAVSMFAATADESADSLDAVARLPDADKGLLLVQVDAISVPRGLEVAMAATALQMVAQKPFPETLDDRIVPLGEEDAQAMYDLAMLTKPGPFSLKAQSFGGFWGVKRGGRLVAMAGQRLKQPGLAELSGVCTHPDARGQGLARLLSLYVARRIEERGERAYLHSFHDNEAAIRLYESIGFAIRATLNVRLLKPAA